MNSLCNLLVICILVPPAWSLTTRWEVGRYGECTESCGRGSQTRSVICKESSAAIRLPERLCPLPKPPSARSCAIVACAPEWSAERWKECSKTCGRGFQHRKLRCSQRLANGDVATVSDDYCPRGRPPTRRRCGVSDCPSRYYAKKWTKCSVSCGGGFQFRQVQCTRIKAGSLLTQIVATDYCSHLVRPQRTRRCNQNTCTGSAHLMDGRKRFTRLRNSNSGAFYRKRRTHRIKPAVDLGQLRQPELDGDWHWMRQQRMLLNRKRFSRRRSVSVEKARHHRCENILENGLNSSHVIAEVESNLLLSCLLRFHDSNDDLSPIDPAAPPPAEAQRLGTSPYIVAKTDITPSLFPPPVVHVGGTLTVSDSDTVTLLCEATGYPPPVTEWEKDGRSLVANDRLFILRESSPRESSLRFIRPLRSDSGIYACVAKNKFGKSRVETILNVVTRPKIVGSPLEGPNFGLESSDIDTPIGSVIRARTGVAIRISCPVEGFPPPRIRWEKDVTGLGENARILPDDSLEIYPASPIDQGLYNCEATNPIGADYRTSTLLLFEAPHLQEFLSRTDAPDLTQRGLPRLLLAKEEMPIYTLDSHGSAIVGCPVAGHGKPQIAWTYENQPIERSRIKFHILFDGMVLFLEAVNVNSTGVYSCHSRNEVGNLTASLEIRLARYSLIHGGLTECSHSCGGGGIQRVSLNCVRDGNKAVPEWYCAGLEGPEIQTLACNRIDCLPNFHVGPWGPCSRSCGMGERSRKVSCLVMQADDSYREVGTTVCASQLSPESEMDVDLVTNTVPTSKETCFVSACPTWRTGSWSQCGEKCYGLGMGIRVRRLYCINANGTAVSRMECPPTSRPKWRELCFTKRCDPVWVVSKWSSCSRTCGDDGIQTRILNCVYRGNKRQRARNLCDNELRPHVSMPCGRIPCLSRK